MSSNYVGKRSKATRLVGAVFFLGAAAFASDGAFDSGLLSSVVMAQQGGQGSGGPNNSGGSGPNNEGTASGGQGTSTGPGTRNRAGGTGGGGGGNVPSAIGTTSSPLLGGGDKGGPASVGGADWCADYKAGESNTSKRVSGTNLKRLDAARLLVTPEIDKGAVEKKGFPLYNLALYQEVFESKEPDTVLAGTYLGLTATVPVSEGVVQRVNAILCVKGDADTVSKTTNVAENQRISMQ